MARFWTCGKCGTRNPRIRQRCPECNRKRPAAKAPAHRKALDMPYEEWVRRFGERCGICGREPSAGRRLDRDHDHRSGVPRGLLCHRCNRKLSDSTREWLRKADNYLARAGLAPPE